MIAFGVRVSQEPPLTAHEWVRLTFDERTDFQADAYVCRLCGEGSCYRTTHQRFWTCPGMRKWRKGELVDYLNRRAAS